VAVQSSGNRLTRVLGVDSEPVNHGWLCDKGRFTLDSIDGNQESLDPLNASTRLREPLIRVNGELIPTTWGDALARAATILQDAATTPNGVGAIGGAALTNEGAFAWERFVRGVLASDHLDAQYGDGLDGALLQSLPKATIDEAANARVVVTLTGDLREELPILFLRLRENFIKRPNALVEFAFASSGLHSLAKVSMPVRPGEAHLVAEALTRSDGSVLKGSHVTEAELNETRRLLGENGEGVVFIVGRPNFAEDAGVMESAIRVLAERFTSATFLPALRRSNVMGALDMGLGPKLRPGRGCVNDEGRTTLEQLEALRTGEQKAVLLLGCLLGNVLDVEGASAALDAGSVVVVSGHGGKTLEYADVVLPAAVQHERQGTVTNIEGRVTAVTAKIVAPGSAWSDVASASELAEECGQSLGLASEVRCAKVIEETVGYPSLSVLNDVSDEGAVVGRTKERVERRPLDPMAFPGIRSTNTAGLAEFAGAVLEESASASASPSTATLSEISVGRGVEVPPFDAYSLVVNVSRRLYDHGVAVQGSPALANLVARSTAQLNHFDLDRLGLTTGDVVEVSSPTVTLNLPVALSDETPRGTLTLAFASLDGNGADVASRSLVDPTSAITQVRLETK
jgi:NADH-quinone oxidoreductase subunit G